MWTSRFARIGRSLCARSANCSSILSSRLPGRRICDRLRTATTTTSSPSSSSSSSLIRLSTQSSPFTRLVHLQLAKNELTIVRDYRTLANSRYMHASQRLSEDKREESKEKEKNKSSIPDEEPKGLWARFKWMFKRYWYLAVPVHVLTSTLWYGSFFLIAKSGMDVIGWLEYIQVIPDSWIVKLKKAPVGAHLAVAYLLYKIATPARYFVTVYGTHLAIKFLRRTGHLRTTKEMGVSLQKRYTKKRDQATHFRADMLNRWERQKTKRGYVKPRPPKSD